MSQLTRTPLSRSKGQRSRSPGRFTHRGVNASASCSSDRGNILNVETYTATLRSAGAVGSAARGAWAPTKGEEGHIVAASRTACYSCARSCKYKGADEVLLLFVIHGAACILQTSFAVKYRGKKR